MVYLDATNAVVGAENGTVTVTPSPAGTLSTTLDTPAGGVTTASTTVTCSGGLASINGTLQYSLPGTGGTVSAAVTNGIVTPTSLGVALTAGQSVGVSFTPSAGTCPACTLAPITVTVPVISSCSVVVLPVTASVVVGQATALSAVVFCNGLPVPNATVTFNGGAAPV
ncbi:hypothetical protein AB0M55_29755, partial [Streptomyces kronopolitis]